MDAEVVRARAQRHDDFFQRGVAGPFAQPVDGAFHLARAVDHAVERIGHRHAQIVVAVDADGGALDPGHVFAKAANQRAILLRHGIAGGVRDIDHSGPGGDDGGDHLKQVVAIRAPGVFGVELHVVGKLPRQLDGIHRHGQDFALLFGQRFAVPFIPELAADVDVRGADPSMDAGPLTLRQGFAAGLDIGGYRTREGADGGSPDFAADHLHGFEIFGRGVRIAGLDHIHIQLRQLPGDDEFLPASQAGAGGLFSVPQCRVEYGYFFRHGLVH